MRAKGRSPTSAIAPPASIENHAGGQSPSRILIKLPGCQQSQIASSNSNSLCRERDAQSCARRSTSRHLRYRAVPRANRILKTANSHDHPATSSTTEPPAGVPSLLWQCFCVDASPGECTDVSSQGGHVLLLGLLPPTRSATTNCLAC